MRQWLDKYYGLFRKIKANYVLLNLFNRKKLKHTEQMYRKYGIDKSVIMPVSSADMPNDPGQVPWLDKSDAADSLHRSEKLSSFPSNVQEQIKLWPERGFIVLRSLFSPDEIKAINTEIDELVASGEVDYNFTGRKIMFAFKHSALLRSIVKERRILDILDFVLGKEMLPFQSINFTKGSEQEAHSDSIHMTTYPLGYLSAAWIALEPIDSDNGPVYYYPGSHRLPYTLNADFDHGGGTFTIGEDAYAHYEEAIARQIKEYGLQPEEFHAQPGDVLIWHANLIHGGKKMIDPERTRNSMVIHYFGKDVVCYHELTQRPAMMEVDFE
jgi:ectoine hydroxylase-related dioxygenase (phytanoyl-CoA dioxygenase family)